jgi:uncharacterized protein YbjT (DUF2867 family)
VIAVVGASGTIGRRVVSFLEVWGAPFVRRDARLEGDEALDASDPASVARGLDGCSVVVNCADYRLNLPVMRDALAAGVR